MKKKENGIIENIKAKQDYSNIVPVWKFIVMSILSFDLYQFYWFYKNWKDLKKAFLDYKNFQPFLLLLGSFLVPFLGLYLMYKQITIINIENVNYNPNYEKLNTALIVFLYILLCFLGKLNPPYNVLIILNFIPFIFVQQELNTLWKNKEGYKKPIKVISFSEILIILIGFCGWLCTLYYLISR